MKRFNRNGGFTRRADLNRVSAQVGRSFVSAGAALLGLARQRRPANK
jgi:hypothetical protein